MTERSTSNVSRASEDQIAKFGSSNVNIIFADAKYISAIALAISVICAFYAFETGRQTAQYTYWLQRNEVFLEQLSMQGVKVPCDLRPNSKECKK